MNIIANRRSAITLFSGQSDIFSHQVRLVLAEKGINFDIRWVDHDDKPEDLLYLNPYQSVPTLVDRDLVLYHTRVIAEYIDERFPHPPLMQAAPAIRAANRLMIHRIRTDLYTLNSQIQASKGRQLARLRREMCDHLAAINPEFTQQPFFMNEELSLVDCALLPLLWRLPVLGINLPKQAVAVAAYAERLFARASFQSSLSEIEREMRA